MNAPSGFQRWPLLLAAVTLTGSGLALDLADETSAPYAAACLVLGATAFGGFIYAEGARHRDWQVSERAARPLDSGDPDPPTIPPT